MPETISVDKISIHYAGCGQTFQPVRANIGVNAKTLRSRALLPGRFDNEPFTRGIIQEQFNSARRQLELQRPGRPGIYCMQIDFHAVIKNAERLCSVESAIAPPVRFSSQFSEPDIIEVGVLFNMGRDFVLEKGKTMKSNISFLSGLAGSLFLTGVHQILKNHVSKAPRLDHLGMEALEKTSETLTGGVPDRQTAYNATLVGDIAGNAAYFSLVRLAPEHACVAGATLGVLAGAGAVMLPEKLGLDEHATNASLKTKVLTVALYTAGGLLTGLIYKWARKKAER